jgi:hypothetical protein
MKNRALVKQWLIRARSNLDRARAGKIQKTILYEDLCFDCQQAVEKSLKALLIAHDVKKTAHSYYCTPVRNTGTEQDFCAGRCEIISGSDRICSPYTISRSL